MIETARLLIRAWRDTDRAPFAAMGRDPEVMATIGPLQSRAETDLDVDHLIARGSRQGHVFWAVERRADAAFLGFCGIEFGDADLPIADLPEIGWRLARAHWGLGYATEAAAACLAWAWTERDWPAVYAIASPSNVRSLRVMERLGMARVPAMAFNHPTMAADDPRRAQITYVAYRPRVAA